MQIIPLQPVPWQTVSVLLADQSCDMRVYQQLTGLYIDLYIDNVLIIGGVLCHNIDRIVRNSYLGFLGDLVFIDNLNQDADPYYIGLGDQFSLAYLSVDDLNGADG